MILDKWIIKLTDSVPVSLGKEGERQLFWTGVIVLNEKRETESCVILFSFERGNVRGGERKMLTSWKGELRQVSPSLIKRMNFYLFF